MYKPEDGQYTRQIAAAEYNMVLNILKNYEIQIKNITRQKNEYRIDTLQGSCCLKRTRHGKNNVLLLFNMSEYITHKGFCSVPGYFKTKDGKLFVKYKHCYFYLTDFIEGRAANPDDPAELIDCVKTLAGFHASISGTEGAGYFEVQSNLKNWPLIFMEYCSKLGWYKRIIDKKNIRSDFDNIYYFNIDYYKKIGTSAMELLSRANFHELSDITSRNRSIFIKKFSSKNLIYSNEGKIIISDISTAVKDTTINNLGKIMRKILSRDSYGWKFKIAEEIIEAFRSIVPMSDDELKGLLAFIIFPFEFCKLGRRRYEKHKYWSEEKYMRKINKQLKYKDKISEFIKDYTAFYGIDMEGIL